MMSDIRGSIETGIKTKKHAYQIADWTGQDRTVRIIFHHQPISVSENYAYCCSCYLKSP